MAKKDFFRDEEIYDDSSFGGSIEITEAPEVADVAEELVEETVEVIELPAEGENEYIDAAVEKIFTDLLEDTEDTTLIDEEVPYEAEPELEEELPVPTWKKNPPADESVYTTDRVYDAVAELPNWIKEINPNYDPYDYDSPYGVNCGSCAYAVYRRLQGDRTICATAQNIPYNSEMEALTGMQQVSMSPWEIEQRLLQQGDGAHAIIGIDRAQGSGHWFNAVCMNGKVYAVDGQTGEINDWPPDYGNVVNWEMSI